MRRGPWPGWWWRRPSVTSVFSWLKIDTDVFVVEHAGRRPRAAAVLVVHEELVGRGQPGLEVPRVEDEAHAAAVRP